LTRPRVFISYSHDSQSHKQRVLELADSLRADGVDASLDQYESGPPEGWRRWAERLIRESDYVIVIATAGYLQKAENVGAGPDDPGRGVRWETLLHYNERMEKLIPCVFTEEDRQYIPLPLRGQSFYDLSAERGYEFLYRAVTSQPLIEAIDVAEEIKLLPPLEHQPSADRWGTTNPAGKRMTVRQPPASTAPPAPPAAAERAAAVPEPPRDAMRAFLQRSEVRLSTMHRIAGVFLNGAGLLLLFPILFRDTLADVVECVTGSERAGLTAEVIRIFATDGPRAALLIASAVMFALPLLALYLLVRDLIGFYFTAHDPYRDLEDAYDEQFYPRLGLAGLSFPSDEMPSGDKRPIWRLQELPHLRWFLLPRRKKDKAYYDGMPARLIPPARKEWVAEATGGAHDRRRLALAFGLAAVSDRPLMEEVARAEVSLVRHSLLLRRLVLRYVKALMVFIVLLMFAFFVTLFGTDPPNTTSQWANIAIGFAYIGWSIITALCVRLPIWWIYEPWSHDATLSDVGRDPQLVKFERIVFGVCWTVLLLAAWFLWHVASRTAATAGVVAAVVGTILLAIFFTQVRRPASVQD
jgi:TIR domain